jgi:hypothetical protein
LQARTKNALSFIGLLLAFLFLEVFYFDLIIPYSTTFGIQMFWEYFIIWLVASFTLSAFLGRSGNGARLMMLIAAIIFIVAGSTAEALPTTLEPVVGPMLPGWYGGLLLFLCVYVVKGSSLLQRSRVQVGMGCPSCGAQLLENAKVCNKCGHKFGSLASNAQSDLQGKSERNLFVIRGALSRQGRYAPIYDLYFTDRRIVAIKVGNFFFGRKSRNNTESDISLDRLLQEDPVSNYYIPWNVVGSLKMSAHSFLTSFSGKSFEIVFSNTRRSFSVTRQAFVQLEERLPNIPGLSNKIR